MEGRWLVTVKQAAERLEISLSLCYKLVEQGRLPCIRLGGQGRRGTIRVSEDDLRRFVESLKRPSPA